MSRRGGDLLLPDEPGQRSTYLEQAGAAAAVIVGRCHLLLDVRDEDDLLVSNLAPLDPPLDHALFAPARVLGVDVDLDLDGPAGVAQPLPDAVTAPGRHHDPECAWRSVADPLHSLRLVGDATPRDLVRGVEGLPATGRVGDDAEGPSLPDGFLHHRGGTSGRQHHATVDHDALVVAGRGPGADVDELGRHMSLAAVVCDRDGHLAEVRELHRPGAEEPRLAGLAGPGAPGPLLADEAHVIQPGVLRTLADVLGSVPEIPARPGPVEVGQVPHMLERTVAGELVHEGPPEVVRRNGDV